MWFVFFILSLAVEPDCQAAVETLAGREFVGKLFQLDRNVVILETAPGRKMSFPMNDLLALTLQSKRNGSRQMHAQTVRNAASDAVEIELDDRSIVLGRRFSTHNDTAVFNLFAPDSEQPYVEIATQRIVAVRLQQADADTDCAWRHLLKQYHEGNIAADLLVINNNGSLDYHRGVLGDVSQNVVEFSLDDDSLSVPRRKVFGLIYHRAASSDDLPSAICRVLCSDGSCWFARSIELREGRFFFDTPGGIEISLPQSVVKRLDFSTGKILYIDDLAPEHVDWTPYFGHQNDLPARRLLFAPRLDRDENGDPIRMQDKRFPRGIMLRSRTELVYRLPDGFSRFRAKAGINDRVRPNGHVRLVIHGDQRVMFERSVSGADAPLELDIDIAGVKKLRILVDYGTQLDTADQLILAEARLVK